MVFRLNHIEHCQSHLLGTLRSSNLQHTFPIPVTTVFASRARYQTFEAKMDHKWLIDLNSFQHKTIVEKRHGHNFILLDLGPSFFDAVRLLSDPLPPPDRLLDHLNEYNIARAQEILRSNEQPPVPN
jgi:hypothetical protein